jgi:predicted transcriptional regulator
MKTATLPSLRVDPQLRRRAIQVLREGETLSSFAESAVRQAIQDRLDQAAFIKRGLASGALARQTGEYVSSEAMLRRLAKRLQQARGRRGSPSRR